MNPGPSAEMGGSGELSSGPGGGFIFPLQIRTEIFY